MGGCVVISDKAQRTRKWALSWAQYRRRDTLTILCSFRLRSDTACKEPIVVALTKLPCSLNKFIHPQAFDPNPRTKTKKLERKILWNPGHKGITWHNSSQSLFSNLLSAFSLQNFSNASSRGTISPFCWVAGSSRFRMFNDLDSLSWAPSTISSLV